MKTRVWSSGDCVVPLLGMAITLMPIVAQAQYQVRDEPGWVQEALDLIGAIENQKQSLYLTGMIVNSFPPEDKPVIQKSSQVMERQRPTTFEQRFARTESYVEEVRMGGAWRYSGMMNSFFAPDTIENMKVWANMAEPPPATLTEHFMLLSDSSRTFKSIDLEGKTAVAYNMATTDAAPDRETLFDLLVGSRQIKDIRRRLGELRRDQASSYNIVWESGPESEKFTILGDHPNSSPELFVFSKTENGVWFLSDYEQKSIFVGILSSCKAVAEMPGAVSGTRDLATLVLDEKNEVAGRKSIVATSWAIDSLSTVVPSTTLTPIPDPSTLPVGTSVRIEDEKLHYVVGDPATIMMDSERTNGGLQ